MRYLSIFLLIFLASCKPSNKELTAQQIIDKTMLFSGADKVANSKISFKFREKEYVAVRKNGNFKLFRNSIKKNSDISEVLSNNGYLKFIDNQVVSVADSMITRYSNSINSVHYFSVLPFGLNDKAVNKKLLKSSNIKGKEYYKVEITFSEDGGGEDFEDVFIYWVGKEDFLVDYLAYSYHTNKGGKRFRVLKEQCVKNGIRFVDFYNYKPMDKVISLSDLDKVFEKSQLKKISEIVLKDIEVELYN